MSKTIPPLDLMWLAMETSSAPTHVGALMLFGKPKGRPGAVREIVEAYRAVRPTPPFNCVPDLAAGVPKFRETTDYDPYYHVQYIAMPADASYEEFLRVVTDLHEPVLDRARPLFRAWVIDGVPGDRFAIYSKVHHAIIDGASGTRRIYASLSPSPRDPVHPPAFGIEMTPRRPRARRGLVDRLSDLGSAATRQTMAVKDVSLGALRKAYAALTGDEPGGSVPFTAHHGPMNEPLQAARSYATLSLPLEAMHSVAKRRGATLNDLSVALVDAGLHRYLRETGRSFPHRFVAMCPVSLRDEGDTEAATKASAMFVRLGEPDIGIVERLERVRDEMTVAKQEMRSMSKDAAMAFAIGALGLAEFTSATGIAQVTRPLANLVISNVPGGRERMYVNGAPMVGTFPVSAVAASVGLNATLTSYADRMDFGFIGNGRTMHTLPRLAKAVADAWAELEAAPMPGAKRTRRPRKTAAKRPARRRPPARR
ncbi:MAG: wax ester/triacylglycerol synthase family O-acyltransferase [Steroidobacteraceae bacterium]